MDVENSGQLLAGQTERGALLGATPDLVERLVASARTLHRV
jgi:hypothetical protein